MPPRHLKHFPAMVFIAALCFTGLVAAHAQIDSSAPAPISNIRFRPVLDAKSPPPSETVYEVIPEAREGYHWAAGYWAWNGKRHFWQHGRWIKDRPGQVWVADSWVQRGDRWRMIPGHWEPDLDTIAMLDTEETASDPQGEIPPTPAAKSKTAVAKKKAPNYRDKRVWIFVRHH